MHSDIYKKLNPIRARYDYEPNQYAQMPFFLGVVPQFYWTYGNLDYSFNKYHRHYQAHDDWYADTKCKTLGHKANGSMTQPNMKNSKYMTLVPNFMPRGCYKEVRKYQMCAAKENKDACVADKISIMEVCPDHVLEGLREKKKWYLRAESIDNETYKRAMTVGDYNRGRSVSDLHMKTWAHGKSLRSDSTWEDDRWNPTVYKHPHRNDGMNKPEQEYSDMFGGNLGTAESKEYDDHALNSAGQSSAMSAHRAAKRKAAVNEVNNLNKEEWFRIEIRYADRKSVV